MDSYVNFYTIEKLDEKLPDEIDLDLTKIEYDYVTEHDANEWHREFGQKCLVRYKSVDSFSACKKIFGERPTSMVFLDRNPFSEYDCYGKDRRYIGRLTSGMIEPFYYTVEETFYYFKKERISSAYFGGIDLTMLSGQVTYEELMSAARNCVDYYFEEGEVSYCAETLCCIMKAAFLAKEGKTVFCDKY